MVDGDFNSEQDNEDIRRIQNFKITQVDESELSKEAMEVFNENNQDY